MNQIRRPKAETRRKSGVGYALDDERRLRALGCHAARAESGTGFGVRSSDSFRISVFGHDAAGRMRSGAELQKAGCAGGERLYGGPAFDDGAA